MNITGVLDELKQRYLAVGLKCEIEILQPPPGNQEYLPGLEPKILVIKIPKARETKDIVISERIAAILMNCQLEYCKLLRGYEAIWSDPLNFIECEIDTIFNMPTRMMLNKISRMLGIEESEDGPRRFDLPSPKDGIQISIGIASVEYTILLERRSINNPIPRALTLRIDGVDVSTHDDAAKTLERVGNAVLFQFDLVTNVAFSLAIEMEDQKEYLKRPVFRESFEVSPVRFEYDKEPMSLYWYARRARRMPLLQFLAYYQVLEFYFPVYSERQAQELIRNKIKDPRFNVNRDSDIATILSIVKVSSGGRAFGDENSQLRSTIQACVNSAELTDFLKDNSSMVEFFKSKIAKSISKKTINTINQEEILLHVSDRIYDIRCRVVHTKSSQDEVGILLPYSSEEQHLVYDIELIAYIAKKVLISGSRPMHL